MTGRKKKAIEIIGRALQSWYSEGHLDGAARNAECGPIYEIAEALYNRIAPLIRGEFPEDFPKQAAEIIKRWGNYAKNLKDKKTASALFYLASNLRDWTDSLKRLWEGQPPLEGDNILEQEQPKGTCQTCGGSGMKWPHGNHQQCSCSTFSYSHRCPDCKGAGDCQHKGKWAYASADNENWLPRCLDCGEEVERRSGERREGKEKISDIPHRDGTPAPVYEQVVHMGKLWDHARPNRRTKDRRKVG